MTTVNFKDIELVYYYVVAIIWAMMIPVYKKILSKQMVNILLAVFVLSVLNMGIQIPAHAAMQQSMGVFQQAQDAADRAGMDHSGMNHSDMQQANMQPAEIQSCECPPTLCEAVEAHQDQYKQNNNPLVNTHTPGFYSVFVIAEQDNLHQLSAISFQYHELQYHQHTPPPISLTTELQI